MGLPAPTPDPCRPAWCSCLGAASGPQLDVQRTDPKFLDPKAMEPWGNDLQMVGL